MRLIGADRSAGYELFELALERLLDDPSGVLVTGQRLGQLLGLLEADVRRQRQDLRIGDRLEQDGTVVGKRLVPGWTDLVGALDADALDPEHLGVACER